MATSGKFVKTVLGSGVGEGQQKVKELLIHHSKDIKTRLIV